MIFHMPLSPVAVSHSTSRWTLICCAINVLFQDPILVFLYLAINNNSCNKTSCILRPYRTFRDPRDVRSHDESLPRHDT